MIDLDVNSMYPKAPIRSKIPPKFIKSGNPTIVDGERWYELGVYDAEIVKWIRGSDTDLWVETTSATYPTFLAFDINEKLCIMLELRYG